MKQILGMVFGIWILCVAGNLEATPYITDDMRQGPVKAGISFWGQTEDGKYFDGITYSNETQLKVPKTTNIIDVHISRRETSYQERPHEVKRYFSFQLKEVIEDFSGKIEIQILNPDGTVVSRSYEGWPYESGLAYSYAEMNLTGAQEKAKLRVDLLLEDGKVIKIPVKNTTAWEWGLIANLPVNIGKMSIVK